MFAIACLKPGDRVVAASDQRLGIGLLLAQLQAQTDPFDLGGSLASVQRVGAAAASGIFLCNALDSCERLMWTPSRSTISARSRAIVQLRRSLDQQPDVGRRGLRRDRPGLARRPATPIATHPM
jgi:hypothetical protein